MLEHVGEQQGLGIGVRRLERAECFSPNYLLGMGGSAGLVVSRDPHLAARMVRGTVVVLDSLGDSCPEGFKGRKLSGGHAKFISLHAT